VHAATSGMHAAPACVAAAAMGVRYTCNPIHATEGCMSLVPCLSCERPISSLATACPACGAPVLDDTPGCLSVILGLAYAGLLLLGLGVGLLCLVALVAVVL